MFGRRKLSKTHKLQAVRVAKDAYAQANGNKDLYEKLVKEDSRTVGIDPMLILLFIKLAMAIWDYFKNRKATVAEVTDIDEDEAILGAVRFYKG